MTQPRCRFCGSPLGPRARFCPTCGRAVHEALPALPVEGALRGKRQIHIQGDSLNIRELLNVVESSVQWWQSNLDNQDHVTRAHAAQAIHELSQILQSLSQQLQQGRETVQITTRLPALRPPDSPCPGCGRVNRDGAKFCLACGTVLSGVPGQTVPPMAARPVRRMIGARTHKGMARKINEDTVSVGTLALRDGATGYLCIVADGMGGAQAGEYASQRAIEVARTYIRNQASSIATDDDAAWQNLLHKAASEANALVFKDSRTDRNRRGMGTTLVIALIVGERMQLASVGDSRAYLLNRTGVTQDGRMIAQLTSDHTLVARLVDIGQLSPAEARKHPQRNILYRSVGTDPLTDVDTRSDQLAPGDCVLLCSDGLVNHVDDHEISQIVLNQPDPDRACDELVNLANQRGGLDNITVVIVAAGTGKV